MKKINNLLQEDAEKHTPDVYSKVMIEADKLGVFANGNDKNVSKKQKFSFGKIFQKNSLRLAFACAIILIFSLAIILPNINRQKQPPTVFEPVELNANEFYGLGAISTVKLLNDIDNSGLTLQKNTLSNDTNSVEAQYFKKYFKAFENFLGEGFISTNSEVNTDSQYSEYSLKLNINSSDILNNKNNFVLYYNEQENIDSEDERSYRLDGVMIFDSKEYKLLGERSVSSELHVTEEELKIRAFMRDNSNNYVEMEQEISQEKGDNEVEYLFRIFSDGALVEETSVEFETEIEDGKKSAEFELEFNKDGVITVFKTDHEIGSNKIIVDYETDGKTGSFEIDVIIKDGEKYYDYVI